MDILLSHTSALAYLREHSADMTFERSTHVAHAPMTVPPPDVMRRLPAPDGCVHVLVGKPAARRVRPGACVHVETHALPTGTILRPPATSGRGLGGTLRVCCPELVFVQLAQSLALIPLIELGYELCGTYSVRPSDGELVQRPPLTTPNRIDRTIRRCGDLRGTRLARRALQFVLPRSASPMETALAMLLALPPRLGGYGLPRPRLNEQLVVPRRLQADVGRSEAYPDIYFADSREAVEYESDEHHLSPEKYARDSQRRAILSRMGVGVTTISRIEMFDPQLLDTSARSVARRIDHRLRRLDDAWRRRRRTLRKTLLGPYQERLRSEGGRLAEPELDRALIECQYGLDEWGNIVTWEEARQRGISTRAAASTSESAAADESADELDRLEAGFWESVL